MLWQTCWCCRDLRKTFDMAQDSTEKLEETRLTKRERVTSTSQNEQLAKMQSLFCQSAWSRAAHRRAGAQKEDQQVKLL